VSIRNRHQDDTEIDVDDYEVTVLAKMAESHPQGVRNMTNFMEHEIREIYAVVEDLFENRTTRGRKPKYWDVDGHDDVEQ